MKIRGPIRASSKNESGYILLILMLAVSLLVIGFLAIGQDMATKIRRDREEEMIHRGVQYSRAIRRYVKKFGRYPTRIEELEQTNNVRFLRKRYKDPITGTDFKLLHINDVRTAVNTGLGMGGNPAAAAGAGQPGMPAGTPATQAAGQSGNQTDSNSGSEDSDSKSSQPSSSGFSGPVFGGGPIVGVASTSKAKTIREFNHKNHYNQWQFIYDPTSDRGGLINTPYQPPLQGAVQNVNGPNAPGSQASPSPGFGNPNQQPFQNQQPLQNSPMPTMPPDQNSPQR